METTIFDKFYKENKRSVQNFIFKKTHDQLVAEELVNDVFVKVYHNMHKFDPTKATMKTWVFNIATNATIDYLRKRKLETKSMFDMISDSEHDNAQMDFASDEASPLDQLITNESQEKITKAIKTLSATDGEIISQYALGFSYEDIATELGIPIGTVKAKMHFARNRMKEYFNKPVHA